ncbi:hypothetical protein PHLGIDRAFT_267626 [Phlebiopsis gigantea 11061_1 CR5-6]|uniref:Uncharacterized protein n=1 Tax=Phlebiopsis gigantea (strain 11061_1 CR5-6) TaxID=745531 RepID=A0A0C3PCW0_PHLG1|nr:hypothetical protein PHLGIDRAFT_267626 [Phlebiopsis gigantea 11061_1 CR5-6]
MSTSRPWASQSPAMASLDRMDQPPHSNSTPKSWITWVYDLSSTLTSLPVVTHPHHRHIPRLRKTDDTRC